MWLPGFWQVIAWIGDQLVFRGRSDLRLARWYANRRPNDVNAWILLSKAHRAATDERAAERALRDGLRVLPGNAELLLEIGSSLVHQGKFDEAERLLLQLAGRAPLWERPCIELADISARREQFDLARQRARDAERLLNPGRPMSWTELAIVMLAIPGELREASDLLIKASRAHKDYLTNLILAALLEKEDPEAATKHYRRGRRYWPGRRRDFESAWFDVLEDVEAAIEIQERRESTG